MPTSRRIASIKAGGLSALVCGTVVLVGAIANTLLAARWSVLTVLSLNWAIFLHLANAVLAGFLFGVTYRYVVRQGENPHLSSGAVLAFALVRGLAQLETGWMLHGNPTLLLLLGGRELADDGDRRCGAEFCAVLQGNSAVCIILTGGRAHAF